jgi:virulence-associated protein VagC
VLIERHGEEVVLRPLTHTQFKSFTDIARHLAESFPDTGEFPEPPPRPSAHERPIPEF